ncbi:hypothetical protein GIB67_011496 [Kingdonia uniflora]|uniref:Uncharacterized protein n=1 Tax=Kingdonia uniflora TaxID=39325 RepID=A0A7J7NLK4_9MAGN|nr:hypothetical protein GIB67_011496 [Kingdonia uniflora]
MIFYFMFHPMDPFHKKNFYTHSQVAAHGRLALTVVLLSSHISIVLNPSCPFTLN